MQTIAFEKFADQKGRVVMIDKYDQLPCPLLP